MTLRQINEDESQKNTILLEPLKPSTVQLAQTRVYLYLEQLITEILSIKKDPDFFLSQRTLWIPETMEIFF